MEELKMLKKLIEDYLVIREKEVDKMYKKKKENDNYQDLYMYHAGVADGYRTVLVEIKEMLGEEE